MDDSTLWSYMAYKIGPTFPMMVVFFVIGLSLLLYGVYLLLTGASMNPKKYKTFATIASVTGTSALGSGSMGTLIAMMSRIVPLFEPLANGDKKVLGTITNGMGHAYASTVLGLAIMILTLWSIIPFRIARNRM